LEKVDDYVVDGMFLCCFEYYVAYRTCKLCRKSFWVIGGSKLGFWMKRVRKFVNFLTAQMKIRLKRDASELQARYSQTYDI